MGWGGVGARYCTHCWSLLVRGSRWNVTFVQLSLPGMLLVALPCPGLRCNLQHQEVSTGHAIPPTVANRAANRSHYTRPTVS